MANTPNILAFGLPAEEESLLRKCTAADELLRSRIGIHRSLGALLSQPVLPSGEFKNGVEMVVLDRTYDIGRKTYASKGSDPFTFEDQFACVRMWFPKAQVLCSTNSPIRFQQEQCGVDLTDPLFLGVSSYATLHKLFHFGDAPKK